MNLPVIIIGTSEHAKPLIEILDEMGVEILGFTSPEKNKKNYAISGRLKKIPILGDDSAILDYSPKEVSLVMGLNGISTMAIRTEIFNRYKRLGYFFMKLVHPRSIVSKWAHLEEGVQVLAGSTIQAEAKLGKMVCINTNSTIDHGSHIGNFVNITCGVTIAGNVQIGQGSYIGAGATIIDRVIIGSKCLLAAGSVVTNNVPENNAVKGVPAQLFKTNFSLS